MADACTRSGGEPWLAIIGIGEDGLSGLTSASCAALARAEIVFGGARHLALAEVGDRGRAWPLPFSVEPVLACKGRRVAVLASGDPFWHGAGGTLAAHLSPGDWVTYPKPSAFSLAAARLGWRLETVTCLGLHAGPVETLLPHLVSGARLICLVRDGAAVGTMAGWLTAKGFGASKLHVMEALGGPSERIRETRAANSTFSNVAVPVAVALEVAGAAGLSRAAGLPDALFANDGQITKGPVRALTLSALAPRPGELLWDIGAGSGSVSIEWCLAGGRAITIEARADRVKHIRANAATFGLAQRLGVVEGKAPAALVGLAAPNAVFIGGGAGQTLIDGLWTTLPAGTRFVVNAVTLETEALLLATHARHGGELMRIELAQAAPLGSMRSWMPSRPLVQWSVVR